MNVAVDEFTPVHARSVLFSRISLRLCRSFLTAEGNNFFSSFALRSGTVTARGN